MWHVIRQSVKHVGSGLDVACYQAQGDWVCGWEYELLSIVCIQVSTWVYIVLNEVNILELSIMYIYQLFYRRITYDFSLGDAGGTGGTLGR